MVFSSVTFLFFFLPAVIALYAASPKPLRNFVLTLSSVVFYVWGSGALVAVLFASVVIDYGLGFAAGQARRNGKHGLIRALIGVSVATNLGMLAWFKYAGWLIASAADAGLYTGTAPEVVLPIGISFFTFQSMSYTIDVARGRCEHLANPVDFALFVTLFPQLIAGPIVRYHEIEPEIRTRRFTVDQLSEGAVRFAHGLVKKVVVADTVGGIAGRRRPGTLSFRGEP